MTRPEDEDFGAHFVVELFRQAYLRAQQLEKEGYWGEDVYLNASAALDLYDKISTDA